MGVSVLIDACTHQDTPGAHQMRTPHLNKQRPFLKQAHFCRRMEGPQPDSKYMRSMGLVGPVIAGVCVRV